MSTKYGILDCNGEVIRWLNYKTSKHYKYVTVKKPKINLDDFEEELF